MAKLNVLVFTVLTLLLSNFYLFVRTEKVSNATVRAKVMLELARQSAERLDEMSRNTVFIKKRIPFIKNAEAKDMDDFVTKMATRLGIDVIKKSVDRGLLEISVLSESSVRLMAFLKGIIRFSPALVAVRSMSISRAADGFSLKLVADMKFVRSIIKKHPSIKYSRGFDAFDNTIIPKCVIGSPGKRSVLIGGSWMKEGDKRDSVIIRSISGAHVVLVDKFTNHEFHANIGQKVIICPPKAQT